MKLLRPHPRSARPAGLALGLCCALAALALPAQAEGRAARAPAVEGAARAVALPAAQAAVAVQPPRARKPAAASSRKARRDAPEAAAAMPTPVPAEARTQDVQAPSLMQRIEGLWRHSRAALLPAAGALGADTAAVASERLPSAPPAASAVWNAALRDAPAWFDWMLQVQAWQDPAQAVPLGLRPRLTQEPDSAVLRSHRLERDVALSGRLQPQIKLGLTVRF